MAIRSRADVKQIARGKIAMTTSATNMLAEAGRIRLERRLELAAMPEGWPALLLAALVVGLCWTIVWMYRREGRAGAGMLEVMINSRHQDALNRARDSLRKAREAFLADQPVELVAVDLHTAVNAVGGKDHHRGFARLHLQPVLHRQVGPPGAGS